MVFVNMSQMIVSDRSNVSRYVNGEPMPLPDYKFIFNI